MSPKMGDLLSVLAPVPVLELPAAAGAQQHCCTQPFPAAPFTSCLPFVYEGSWAALGRCCSASGIPAKGAVTFGRQ